MPDNPGFVFSGFTGFKSLNDFIDRPKLLIAGDFLNQLTFYRFKEDKVLDNIQEILMTEQAGNESLLGSDFCGFRQIETGGVFYLFLAACQYVFVGKRPGVFPVTIMLSGRADGSHFSDITGQCYH